MKKPFWESKTIQGIFLAVVGYIWGLWSGETTFSQSIVAAGLGWAGLGFRVAMK